MRFAERLPIVVAMLLVTSVEAPAQDASPVHQVRYAMGTMFDIVAYHSPRDAAERAIDLAMAEIVRLDNVMSHFKSESDLSRLNREGRDGFVAVDASLYDVVRQSIEFAQQSNGRFDVTIAPLLRVWRQAREEGRTPSDAEVNAARRCVGADKVETREPNRIRYREQCVEIDLGGIGKGYAVERAIAILKREGIDHALVNAGGSSIAAIGAPPGRSGWPVHLGADRAGQPLLLRDESLSTSQQDRGHIIDPTIAGPARDERAVSVIARSATIADALSTTLLMCSMDDARRLLARFPDASAIWMSASGEQVHVP